MDQLLETFQLNTFGHLLTFKHFYPLLPQKNDMRKSQADSADHDPANGAVHPGLSVLASLTAKVGSMGDNKKGGASSILSLSRSVRVDEPRGESER